MSAESVSRNAILHIGTEKTGSTSIQNFLYRNQDPLRAQSVLFPKLCGFVSHHKLVISCQDEPDKNLARISSADVSAEGYQQWLNTFQLKHRIEIEKFHAAAGSHSTVIYSSEHFQSRVRKPNEMERLREFLAEMYDNITVIVYLRRQDKLAISAHNTQVQGGLAKRFSFANANPLGNYYNYLNLVSNWASVFGKDKVNIRLFEKDKMHNGNVVEDFLIQSNIELNFPNMVVPSIENSHLSHTALELLMKFNEQYNGESSINGIPEPRFRQLLIRKLHEVKDEHGKLLPNRALALSFYQQCEAMNKELFDTYLPGQGFDASFSEYPEVDSACPESPSDELLHELINAVTEKENMKNKPLTTQAWNSIKQKYGT